MPRLPRPLMAIALAAAYPFAVARMSLLNRTHVQPFGLAHAPAGALSVSRHSFGGGLTVIGLAHGDPLDQAGDLVEVLTQPNAPEDAGSVSALQWEVAKARFRDRMAAEGEWLSIDDSPRDVPEEGFTERRIDVRVDGMRQTVPAQCLDDYWAAGLRMGTTQVIAVGRRGCPEQLRLCAVTDIKLYTGGTLAFLRRLVKHEIR